MRSACPNTKGKYSSRFSRTFPLGSKKDVEVLAGDDFDAMYEAIGSARRPSAGLCVRSTWGNSLLIAESLSVFLRKAP